MQMSAPEFCFRARKKMAAGYYACSHAQARLLAEFAASDVKAVLEDRLARALVRTPIRVDPQAVFAHLRDDCRDVSDAEARSGLSSRNFLAFGEEVKETDLLGVIAVAHVVCFHMVRLMLIHS